MAAALFLTLLRVVAPFEIGKDQAVQLEAARRLVSGLGLTSTYFVSHSSDISQRPTPKVLTWWPPGFSLIAAAFMSISLSLATGLRVVYGAVTLVGWWGWKRTMSAFVRPAGAAMWPLALAALLPVFFTPPWSGTDIFLWAAVPYVIAWLATPPADRKSTTLVLCAGLLAGLLFSIRYGSASLLLGGLLILLRLDWRTPSALMRRGALFTAAAAVPMAASVAFVRLVSDRSLPTYVNVEGNGGGVAGLLSKLATGLPTLSVLLIGSPIAEHVASDSPWPFVGLAIGALALGGVLALPIIISATQLPGVHSQDERIKAAACVLPLACCLFLITFTVFNTSDYNPVGTARYYEPFVLTGVLTWMAVAAAERLPSLARSIGAAMLATVFAYYLVYLPLHAVVRRDGGQLVRTVLGITLARSTRNASTSVPLAFPSSETYSMKEGSRAAMLGLLSRYPGAVFYVQNYPFYLYDAFQVEAAYQGVDVRPYPYSAAFWRTAYTTQRLSIVWVLNATGALQPASEVIDPFTGAIMKGEVVFHDSYEKTTILVNEFDAGSPVHLVKARSTELSSLQ